MHWNVRYWMIDEKLVLYSNHSMCSSVRMCPWCGEKKKKFSLFPALQAAGSPEDSFIWRHEFTPLMRLPPQTLISILASLLIEKIQ